MFSSPDLDVLLTGLGSMVATVIVAVVFGGLAWLAHYLLTLPLRRSERARLFLWTLEQGLRAGKSVGHTIVSMARRNVTALGWRLGSVADRIEDGATLEDALTSCPAFLPPHVSEMLAVGERVGNVAGVLPVCRKTLSDASSRTRGAMNYLIIMVFGFAGFFGTTLFVIPLIAIYILPRFREMFADMQIPLSPVLEVVVAVMTRPWLYALVCLLPLSFLVCAVFYAGGPRLLSSLGLRRVAGWLHYLMPWRRKRLQRDFSAMLGVLLEAGVPESEALEMAAHSTANHAFAKRGRTAVAALEEGVPLMEAVARLDRSGELRWRLANAAHEGGGFAHALVGWHEWLDAKAFQQEQIASQVITTAVVVLNGGIVAAVAIGIFHCLVRLMWIGVMW